MDTMRNMRNERGILLTREHTLAEPYPGNSQCCLEYDCSACTNRRSLSEDRTAAIITVWAYLHSVTIMKAV